MKPDNSRKKLTEMYPPLTTGLNGPNEWGSAKWKKTRLRAAKQRIPVRAGNWDRRGAAAGRTNTGPAGACAWFAWDDRSVALSPGAGDGSASVVWGVRRSPGSRP